MTINEATRMLVRIKDQINFEWVNSQGKMDALNMAIETLERKRGEWHEYDKPYHLHCCRNCGEDALFTKDGQEVLSNYCAFCGADMRERMVIE